MIKKHTRIETFRKEQPKWIKNFGPVGANCQNLDCFHQLPPVAQVGLLDDLHHEILEPTVVTFGATLSVLEHLGEVEWIEWYTEAVASVKCGEKLGACYFFL